MPADPTFTDELEHWLRGDDPKTLGSLAEVFAEKSFAVTILLLMFVPALPLPTGGVTHVFEGIAVVIAAQMVLGRRTHSHGRLRLAPASGCPGRAPSMAAAIRSADSPPTLRRTTLSVSPAPNMRLTTSSAVARLTCACSEVTGVGNKLEMWRPTTAAVRPSRGGIADGACRADRPRSIDDEGRAGRLKLHDVVRRGHHGVPPWVSAASRVACARSRRSPRRRSRARWTRPGRVVARPRRRPPGGARRPLMATRGLPGPSAQTARWRVDGADTASGRRNHGPGRFDRCIRPPSPRHRGFSITLL